MLRWLGAVRFCYNALVSRHSNVDQGGVNLASMRAVVKEKEAEHAWLGEIPGEIKDVAVRDMDKARKAHFAKEKNGKNVGKKATFKFRSKKDPQQSLEIRARDIVRKTGFFASLGLGTWKSAEPIPKTTESAVRFVRDRLGRYL